MASSTTPPRGSAGPTLVLLFRLALGPDLVAGEAFGNAGLSGPMLSLLTYGVVAIPGLLLLARERHTWRAQACILLALGLVGGSANAAFVNALIAGEVARRHVLFYLSPVWSVLGGRLLLGEPWPRRMAAVGLALAGLWHVMGGTRAFYTPLSMSICWRCRRGWPSPATTCWRATGSRSRPAPRRRPSSPAAA